MSDLTGHRFGLDCGVAAINRRPRPSKRFRQIGPEIPKVLRKLGIERQVAAQRAALDWPKIVGAKVSRHCRALGVEDGVLVVEADSPVWMTQLLFLKPKLMAQVAGRVGSGLIRDIRLVLKH